MEYCDIEQIENKIFIEQIMSKLLEKKPIYPTEKRKRNLEMFIFRIYNDTTYKETSEKFKVCSNNIAHRNYKTLEQIRKIIKKEVKL